MRGGSGNFRNGRVPKMGLGLFLKGGRGGGGLNSSTNYGKKTELLVNGDT